MTTTDDTQASRYPAAVRRLLATVGDRGTGPAEAEALTARAAELLARYGIDRAEFSLVRGESGGPHCKLLMGDPPIPACDDPVVCYVRGAGRGPGCPASTRGPGPHAGVPYPARVAFNRHVMGLTAWSRRPEPRRADLAR